MQNLKNNDIESKLKKIGLDQDECSIYLYLLTQGRKTVSEIRKYFGWSSTKVNDLFKSSNLKILTDHLISEDGRKYYFTKEISRINEIIKNHKDHLTELENNVSNFNILLNQNNYNKPLESKVIHYYGLDGLKQVLWNTTDCKDLLRFYTYGPNGKYMDFNFYDDIREFYVKKRILTKELLNQKSYPKFTKIKKFLEFYESRYINPEIINFKHEVLIYNNVYAIYRADENGIFCMEIHNQKLAQMQKQLFDFIWNRSQKMEVLDKDHGATRVI